MKYLYTSFILLSFIFIACNHHEDNFSSCLENPDSNSKLLVIVGEKISIKEEKPLFDSATYLPYGKFTAHYRILQKVCGDYNKDTITFTAFDHYGFPAFGNYQYALLYLDVTKNEVFHETYLYSGLYKTKDGRWASPYSALDYGLDERRNTTVNPEKIDFAEEVSFNIDGFTRAKVKRWYPEPYYRIDKVNKKAIAVMGNYVPELFQLQKETTLKARGFYGKVEPGPIVSEVKIENIASSENFNLPKKDSLQLLKVWQSFLQAIKTNDTLLLKGMSFDSIVCSACEGMPREYYENNLESINMFIDSANTNFKKSGVWSLLEKNKFKISITKWTDRESKIFSFKKNQPALIYSIDFRKDLKISNGYIVQYHSFQFVKVDNHFLFCTMMSQ